MACELLFDLLLFINLLVLFNKYTAINRISSVYDEQKVVYVNLLKDMYSFFPVNNFLYDIRSFHGASYDLFIDLEATVRAVFLVDIFVE